MAATEIRIRGLLIGTADQSPLYRAKIQSLQSVLEASGLEVLNPISNFKNPIISVPDYRYLVRAAFGACDLTGMAPHAFAKTLAEIVGLATRRVPVAALYSPSVYNNFVSEVAEFIKTGTVSVILQSYKNSEHRDRLFAEFAKRVFEIRSTR